MYMLRIHYICNGLKKYNLILENSKTKICTTESYTYKHFWRLGD